MDGVYVYSYEDTYFLLKNKGKRATLCKGRYKGTLHILSKITNYTSMPWLYAPLDQCTPHPEYCNVAWILKEYEIYWVTFYDNHVVSDRFLKKALTSMEDIQKAVFTGHCPFIEGLFFISIIDDTKHIAMFADCDFYKRLLGEKGT